MARGRNRKGQKGVRPVDGGLEDKPPYRSAANDSRLPQINVTQNFLKVAKQHPGSLTPEDIVDIKRVDPEFGQLLQADLFREMEHQREMDKLILQIDDRAFVRMSNTKRLATLAGVAVSLLGFLTIVALAYFGAIVPAGLLAAGLALIIYRALGGKADPKEGEGRPPTDTDA